MYSRAHLLIQRDYDRFKDSTPWGIETQPLKEDSMFEWSARILGLKDTIWEGGVFRLYLKFGEQYNDRPPDVCFHTIPFHPNVDMITGRPCIDFLDNMAAWKNYSFSTVLLTIQMMLSNPVCEDAVNMDAVSMMQKSPHSYRQMILDCVMASQRVEAGLSPHLDSDSKSNLNKDVVPLKPAVPATAGNKRVAHISFEDYYNTWTGIATSKGPIDIRNQWPSEGDESVTADVGRGGLPIEELQHQMETQMQEYQTLMYGKFKTKPKLDEDQLKQSKLDHLNKMKKIYLQPRTPSSAKTPVGLAPRVVPEVAQVKGEEPWEKEVDDLVAWTNNLDEENL